MKHFAVLIILVILGVIIFRVMTTGPRYTSDKSIESALEDYYNKR